MFEKILVATDGSSHAKKALGLASDIALKYEATVYLIHVVSPLSRIPEQDVRQKIRDNEEKLPHQIIKEGESEIEKKGMKRYRSRMLQGYPAQEIIDFAQKKWGEYDCPGKSRSRRFREAIARKRFPQGLPSCSLHLCNGQVAVTWNSCPDTSFF